MRTAFIETVSELAGQDKRIWLLTADLGYTVLEGFAAAHPDRYVNVGVAEQNMAGIAAGLALSGMVVFTYSIANFPTLRCLEQLRNDVCYHNLPVKTVAVGGGLAYGFEGYTHYGVEDLAIMRVLPNMVVIAPGDPVETRLAVRAAVAHPGPCYLRLGKAREPVVHAHPPRFEIGKAIVVRDGGDATIVSTGAVLPLAVQAADTLARLHIEAAVLSMHTLKPVDAEAIVRAAVTTRTLVTIEEHGPIGGLGDAVAAVLARATLPRPVGFFRIALPEAHEPRVGSQAHLRERHHLTAERIVALVRDALG